MSLFGCANIPKRKDDVRLKLIEIFEKTDVEGLVRVLHYLDEGNKACYKDNNAPAWKLLKSKLYSNTAFKKYAEQFIEDTKMAENDVVFRSKMDQIYLLMAKASDDSFLEDFSQFDAARVTDSKNGLHFVSKELARVLDLIPEDRQKGILKIIPIVVKNRQLISAAGVGGPFGVVKIALDALDLCCEAIKNIIRWWKGEISGKRCCKNIIDTTFTIGAGLVGGAALGVPGGAIGIFAGGLIIISTKAMNFLIDRLTQRLFGIPKDEALENAYRFLKVEMTATNSEINSAFRKLCLKHHPDKGGKTEDFLTVQINMSVIKAARGEL